MLFYILTTVLVLVLTWAFKTYRRFLKNLAGAKASNIPYVVVPVFAFDRAWIVTQGLILPILRRLPKRWTHPWVNLIYSDWYWDKQYSIYEEMGSDTFLTVSPGKNALWTADADVINQITTRRNDFPKAIQFYRLVDVFGKNVVTTEGQVWRRHRKITSPPFTEKNNQLVWDESLHQAQNMCKGWMRGGKTTSSTISTVPDDTMRLSLHIISRAGFGVGLLWPGVEDVKPHDKDIKLSKSRGIDSIEMGAGHTMTYVDALGTMLHNLVLVMLVPHRILKRLPFKVTKLAYQSYVNWYAYMDEMYNAKKEMVGAGNENSAMDLMEALVQGSSTDSANKNDDPTAKQGLTHDEVLGNAFVFILAGHETTANSIHFSLLYLATRVSSQRNLQAELDDIFGDRPVSQWDYDQDLPKLFGGLAGAVLNEQLRLIPPVLTIPKWVKSDEPQPLMVSGKKCLVPGETMINLVANAAHRNPKFWPTGPPTDPNDLVHPQSNTDNDIEEFKPERWILAGAKADGPGTAKGHGLASDAIKPSTGTDGLGINAASDTAATLLKPPKGAYIPFSDGYRACLGRRFAQIEILAVLAVVLSQYSVELAVDEWATDEEVEKMGVEERKVVWGKARAKVRWMMRENMGSVITIKFRNGVVPIRFVKRGEERFAGF